MTKLPWCNVKAGYTMYCYIQYKVYSVFYCLSIILLTGLILFGNNKAYASTASPGEFIFSLCNASNIDEGLEVRDEQGRIVRKESGTKQLRDLFLSHLVILLYRTDIHSIAESQASLQRLSNFADLMIGLPVKSVKIFTFAILLPTIKKYFFTATHSYQLPNPKIPILIFPAFFLLVLSRKLSTVTLRL